MKKILLCLILSTLTTLGFAQVSKTEAFVISKDFVKEKLNYPKEANFSINYSCEDDGYRKYIILGKFTGKNAFGVKSDYVYKIWIQYLGGEWTSKSSWTYSKLILEDAATQKQQVYTRKVTPSSSQSSTSVSGNTMTFLGLKCSVVEQNDHFVRIQTPRKLSKTEITKGLTNFSYKDKIVQFCVAGHTKRGQEYAQAQKGYVTIFE